MARKPLEELTEDEFLADLVRTRCPRSILHPPARPDAFRPRSHAAVSIFQRRPALPAIRAENHAPPTPVQISFLQAKGQFKLAPEGCGAYPPDLPEMPIARIFPPRARARSLEPRRHLRTKIPPRNTPRRKTCRRVNDDDQIKSFPALVVAPEPTLNRSLNTPSRSVADPESFPRRTLNGSKLDLFGLYRAVCVRGGFPRSDRKTSDAPKLNWTRDVFTRLANHTDTHKATSVGHDLITHYQNYLAEYEDEHPEDVSVPDVGDDPVEFERCEPKQVGKLPEGAGGAGDGATGRRGRGARRGPGRPRGSGRGARGGGRSRARVPRVKRRAASDFQVGCRVKVFWRAMDEWYSGVIEEQESSEGAEGADGDGDAAAEPVVLSKVVYDDGDVEVLDLVGGVEKVILLTYVDGSATSDAELEPVFEPAEDSEGGDDSDEDETRGGGRGGRRSTRDPRVSVSRRTLAKEENGPSRAPGGGPGARELRRRNPARRREEPDEEPDDARVRAVLERMKRNEAAKSLAELAVDAEPPEEVFRVGYKMGARRAIACAAAVVAAAAARVGPAPERDRDGVDPPRAKERTPELTATAAAGGGDGGGGGRRRRRRWASRRPARGSAASGRKTQSTPTTRTTTRTSPRRRRRRRRRTATTSTRRRPAKRRPAKRLRTGRVPSGTPSRTPKRVPS